MGEQPVVLTDGVVRLRAWEPADAPAVWAACQDALNVRFLSLLLPYTVAVAEAYVARRILDWSSEGERSFAITDATTGEVLGCIAGIFGRLIGQSSATSSLQVPVAGASRLAHCAWSLIGLSNRQG